MLEFLLKQQIKKQFGTYLSPSLVEKLQKNPKLLQLGGESKELSIMFTDVRGFTAISEHYGGDVQGLTSIMNRYMTAMTKRILTNNGTVDKYIGDAQMAFWNAPVDNEHHAFDAVRTGIDMITDLKEFNKEITAEGHPPFAMGLGINTDTVVVGNMGSDQRFDYTCLGDGVNLGARIEGQTKTYGVDIIIGENTMRAVQYEFTTLQLDCIAVKGKTKGVDIYTVMPYSSDTFSSSYVYLHEDMMTKYFSQDFKGAIELCNKLKGGFDGKLDEFYDIWIKRCNGMKRKQEWDGVYRSTTK
jgi:adenylate cyclase